MSENGHSKSGGCGRVSDRGQSGGDGYRIGGHVSESDDGPYDHDLRGSVSGLDRSVASGNESVSGRYGKACRVSGSCGWVGGCCGGYALANDRVAAVSSPSWL